MAVGLYRDETGWVMVKYDAHSAPIPKDRYESQGYQPPYEKLPTKAEYEKANANRT